MVVHQLIERIKPHQPKEVLAGTITKHLEVQYPTTKFYREGETSWCALVISYEEGAIMGCPLKISSALALVIRP